jgi:hypothetical protein
LLQWISIILTGQPTILPIEAGQLLIDKPEPFEPIVMILFFRIGQDADHNRVK